MRENVSPARAGAASRPALSSVPGNAPQVRRDGVRMEDVGGDVKDYFPKITITRSIEREDINVAIANRIFRLLGSDGYAVQIVHAFFDESGSHAGSPVLCVAGYAFQKRAARLLARDWSTVLKKHRLPFFHMVDCAHGNKGFASLTKQQRIEVATSLIQIIKRYAAHGFAVSVDVEAYKEVMPSWAPTNSPYAFCARCVIDEMGRWFVKSSFRGKSSYFFEAGHESRSEAEKVVGAVLTNPLSKVTGVHYGYVAHTFISKEESAAVQAADLLAWQWTTDIKHQIAGRPRRKDFESLLQAPFSGAHFSRERLLHYIQLLEEFGVSSDHESSTMLDQVKRVLYVQHRAKPYMHMDLPSP